MLVACQGPVIWTKRGPPDVAGDETLERASSCCLILESCPEKKDGPLFWVGKRHSVVGRRLVTGWLG
jgi:hypothetical protein